jgi:hypothetical protein
MKEPQGFPTFWEIWRPHARKTDGRKLARETFAKHVRSGADPEDIILGAAWFLRTMKERDREFIPLSSTWMNRGSYEDDCILERQRIAAIEQAKRPDNVVQMTQPRPSEAERAAHVERMRAKLRGNA